MCKYFSKRVGTTNSMILQKMSPSKVMPVVRFNGLCLLTMVDFQDLIRVKLIQTCHDNLFCLGVVFNEMKGVYSQPDNVLGRVSQQVGALSCLFGSDIVCAALENKENNLKYALDSLVYIVQQQLNNLFFFFRLRCRALSCSS